MLNKLKRLKNRGQAMLLYAVLIPLLLLFVGVGLDMGWYYLTVSRMQNASDAAVMAGAWKFLEDEGVLSDYSDALLIDFVPNYILKDPDTDEPIISTRDKQPGDEVAKAYVQKNLAVAGATWTNDTIADAYDEENNTLTFGSQLYGRAQDKDDYGYYTMWYRVELEEDVEHFFLPGWFPAMKATVQSVAKITHYIQGPNLFEQTKAIAEKQTYASWDHIKMAKSNAEADGRSVLSTGNKYRTGDKNRIEVLRLNGRGGVNNNKYGNPYTTTGGKDQTDFDDLFIDWQADMNKMTTDTDLGINGAKSDAGKGWTHFLTDTGTTNLTGNDNLQRRIHGTINFESTSDGSFPYKVRDGREPPDPLYARIESEPVHDGQGLRADGNGGYTRNSGSNGSSVRQIIINLNVPNTTVSGTDKLGYTEYSDRPVFFYYTGPEKNLSGSAEVVDYYDGYNKASHVRDSLPVILNFNADFRGIFFFPNSPVVVNGNDNDFYGYVIAQKFVMLKTYDYKKYSDGVKRGGDFLRYVAPDTKDDVYYDRSLLVEGTIPVSSHDDFTSISINGQTKYVLKSDLINDASDLIAIGGKAYRKDEAGTAEAMAYASGNGKINYYYTKRQKKNEGWTLAGTGWLDRATAVVKNQLAYFQSGWSYNNSGNDTNDSGNPEGQGVWRVKEILPNGTESDTWLDQTDEYKNRFLLKVSGALATHPPQYVYATAEELMSKIDGYTKVDGTDYWKKDDAREYNKVTSNGKTYYLPANVVLFDSDMLVPEDMDGVIPVKYCDENNNEHSGCARISDETKPYYLIYQDDIKGNDTTTDNPMFVDELGNVQYRLKKNADGTDVEYDKEDDPVPYETIEPTVMPTTDDALMNRAIETAVKEMIADLPEEEQDKLNTREERIAYLEENDLETYKAKIDKYFYEYFNYLEDGNVKFFAKDDFNLNKSVFDNFQLVKMTQYSYLNERETKDDDKRSINNFFTNSDAKRTD